jgi:hypothetical protein
MDIAASLFLCVTALSVTITAALAMPFCHGCTTIMENFFTVNLGNVLTIAAFLTGGLAFVYTMRSDLSLQAQRLTLMQELNAARLGTLEAEIRTLRDVLVDMARHATRLDLMEAQMAEMRREKH